MMKKWTIWYTACLLSMLVYSPDTFPFPTPPLAPMPRALARLYPSSALLPGFVLLSTLLYPHSPSSLPIPSQCITLLHHPTTSVLESDPRRLVLLRSYTVVVLSVCCIFYVTLARLHRPYNRHNPSHTTPRRLVACSPVTTSSTITTHSSTHPPTQSSVRCHLLALLFPLF